MTPEGVDPLASRLAFGPHASSRVRRADDKPARTTPALWWDLVPHDERLDPAPPLVGEVRTTTCVVGGGIAGSALALALARRGDEVVLLDREFPGWGATGRNAGFLLADSDCVDLAAAHVGESTALALRDAGLATRKFVRSLQAPIDWTGSVRLASDAGEAACFDATARRGLDGVRAEPLARVPERGGVPCLAALADDGDGMTNPLRLLAAVIRESSSRGVRRHDGTPATSVRRSRDRVVVATTSGRVIARRVVVATNSEARFLLGRDVVPVRPVRAQALAAVVDPAPRWTRPVYATRGGDYWRPVADGVVLLGGLRRLDKRAEATRSTDAAPRLQQALTRMLRRLVGPGSRIRVTHRWAGTMGFTRDGLPFIGAVPGRRGVHLFAGWNGHGLGWSPGFAEALAADLVGDGPSVPATFRPRRS
jgi:gamma-glutamylputrescine oxidase